MITWNVWLGLGLLGVWCGVFVKDFLNKVGGLRGLKEMQEIE